MALKLTITNKTVSPAAVFQIHHAGKNDYRVILAGAGELSNHDQLGIASSKASWFSLLSAADLSYEASKRTETRCSYTDRKKGGSAMKSLDELILGKENQAAASAAVKRAVERANAKGLPKAYEPDFSAGRSAPAGNDAVATDTAAKKNDA